MFSQHLQVFSNWEKIWLVKFLLLTVPSEWYEMLSLHSDPISFSRLSMSSSSTWSYSLKAFPLLLVMYLFMAWPNFSGRDPKLVPVDCGNFHDPSLLSVNKIFFLNCLRCFFHKEPTNSLQTHSHRRLESIAYFEGRLNKTPQNWKPIVIPVLIDAVIYE